MSRSVIFLRCKAILLLTATVVFSLNCRSDDGPSDEDLKRVVRSCMTKMLTENNSDGGWGRNINFNRGYEQSNGDNGDRYNEHFQLKQSARLRRSTPTTPANHRRYDQTQRQSNNNNNNSSNAGEMLEERQERDNACIIHCFFEQINTINNDGYPDRHKLTYALTKDIHSRELRNFYSQTIRECFHYLESRRPKERCSFAKELVQCMTEYARANCDDWQDHIIIFN